jgi:hypothetical protein
MKQLRQAIQLTKASTVVNVHYKGRQGHLRYFILHQCQHQFLLTKASPDDNKYYKRQRKQWTLPHNWRWLQQLRFHSIVYQMVTITKKTCTVVVVQTQQMVI